MIKRLSILILVVLPVKALPQNPQEQFRPANNVFVNVFGDASLISLNYERLFFVNKGFFIAARAGVGYNKGICFFSSCADADPWVTFPHSVTANLGRKTIWFEIGLGGTLNKLSYDTYGPVNDKYLFYPVIGYRFHPSSSGKFVFRISGSFPVFRTTEEQAFIPIGLSFGITF